MKHLTVVLLTALISISAAHAEPDAKPAAEPDAKPAAEPDAKPAAEPDAKPAAETEAKPAAETEAKPAADPVKLECLMADGKPLAFKYIIDIDDKTVKWGLDKYNIVHVSDGYITAYQRTKRVGGEVLVFNRVTGDYKRAKIALLSAEGHQLKSSEGNTDSAPEGHLETHVYEGRCLNQKF